MGLSEKLQQFTEKLQRLQQKIEDVEKDKALLETENEQLKIKLQLFQNEKNVAVNNILEHVEEEKKEENEGTRAALDQDIHQQIDHYLSEIDHCIEWLRQQ